MDNVLKVGDKVYVNAGIEPKLYFIIDEFKEVSGQTMACGKYGCFAIDLLIKSEQE